MPYYLHKRSLSSAEIAAAFDELSFWSSRFGVLLFEHLPMRQNAAVLDLGCGTGFPLFEMAHSLGDSCRMVGVDVWQEGLQRARAKQAICGLPNVHLVVADGADLPFPHDQFDMVVSNLGINNFEDPEAVLAECYRVARPGATLALTTNVLGHMQEFYDAFRTVLERTGKANYLDRLAAQEGHRGTQESVCSLLQGAGFEVAKVVEERFHMRYANGTAIFNHHLTRVGFLDGWRSVVDAEDEEAVFSALEERLNQVAGQQGELRVSVPALYVEAIKPGGAEVAG